MKGIFLVHGEYGELEKFKARLTEKEFKNITIPEDKATAQLA
jgi:hypothetical protein